MTLAGDVLLNAGDFVGLFYESDGVTLGIDLGRDDNSIVWSAHRLIQSRERPC